MLDRRAPSPYFISWALVVCIWSPSPLQETPGRENCPPHPHLSIFCLITALSSALCLIVGGLVRQPCGWTSGQVWTWTQPRCTNELCVWGRAAALSLASQHTQQMLLCVLEAEAQRITNHQPWSAEAGPSGRITATSHLVQTKYK